MLMKLHNTAVHSVLSRYCATKNYYVLLNACVQC